MRPLSQVTSFTFLPLLVATSAAALGQTTRTNSPNGFAKMGSGAHRRRPGVTILARSGNYIGFTANISVDAFTIPELRQLGSAPRVPITVLLTRCERGVGVPRLAAGDVAFAPLQTRLSVADGGCAP